MLLKGFSTKKHLSLKGMQFLTRATKMGLIATNEATNLDLLSPFDLGVVLGTEYVSLEVISNFDSIVINDGPSYVSAMSSPNTLANSVASQLGIKNNATALNTTISTGCCSSLDAIGYAANSLLESRANAVIVGGVDEVNLHVKTYSDSNRANSLGEGAGIVLMQKEESSHPLLYYHAWSSNYNSMVSRTDLIMSVCLDALNRAELSINDISLLAIGANSVEMDAVFEAIDIILRSSNFINKLPCFSLRPLLGNTFGADGVLHIIAVVEASNNLLIPPTKNASLLNCPDSLKLYEVPEKFSPGYTLIIESEEKGNVSAVVVSAPESKNL